MVWSAIQIYDLLVDCKELGSKAAVVICRRLDLGKPIDGFLDSLLLINDIIFSIEEGSSDLLEDDFDYLYAMYNKLLNKHNRYKGL